MAADALVHALAGGLGSFLALLILHPLNQVRLLRQVGKSSLVAGKDSRKTVTLLREMSRGGIQSLYFGVLPFLTVNTLSQGVYFAVYNAVHGRVFFRSVLASVITCVVTAPTWVAWTRLQLAHSDPEKKALKGGGLFTLLARAHAIAHEEGMLALFHGISSSLWLCSVPIVQFWTYEFFRFFSQSPEHPTALEALVMGGLSKLAATALTYPLQLAQARQRADAKSGSLLEVLSSVAREGGFSGLFAGFEAKALLGLLNGAFMMCFYEKILELVTKVLPMTRQR